MTKAGRWVAAICIALGVMAGCVWLADAVLPWDASTNVATGAAAGVVVGAILAVWASSAIEHLRPENGPARPKQHIESGRPPTIMQMVPGGQGIQFAPAGHSKIRDVIVNVTAPSALMMTSHYDPGADDRSASVGSHGRPPVEFEGYFLGEEASQIAFSVSNSSSQLLVISSITFMPLYFKVTRQPGVLVGHAGVVPRTKLMVDLVEAGERVGRREGANVTSSDLIAVPGEKYSRPGHVPKFELDGLRVVSLLGPDKVVHVSPGSSESFALLLTGDLGDPAALSSFTCMFTVELGLILVGDPPASCTLDYMFEASRNRDDKSGIEIRLHPLRLAQPMLEWFVGRSRRDFDPHALRTLVRALAREDFSDDFLADLAYYVPQMEPGDRSETVAGFLRVAARARGHGRESGVCVWCSTLCEVLPHAPADFRDTHADLLIAVAQSSSYDLTVRLFAARFLAGYPAVPQSPGHAKLDTAPPDSHPLELIRGLCAQVLNLSPHVAEMGRLYAVWTLGQLADDGALAILVACLKRKPRSSGETREILRLLEAFSGKRFRSGPTRLPITFVYFAIIAALLTVLWIINISSHIKIILTLAVIVLGSFPLVTALRLIRRPFETRARSRAVHWYEQRAA